ncbi:MAG TPA: hypothetical protein DEB28_15445 [Hyphomonas sp.]|nr:hypothetical protein [Hyphomonas sp.]HBJ41524.1 hypothetical protein [Hyphomonas sp.]HBN91999.1 hypothetical protein [Hyphomonas sp.]HBT36846.1 hypothetical protein [Hyphomonas sp.]HBU35519.1 hypothetical protein [Hyphomonas sp.]|tara:strand:- start:2937 stop:3260 length:324 start_codon:yes stop_codon:yes gene_type:complete
MQLLAVVNYIYAFSWLSGLTDKAGLHELPAISAMLRFRCLELMEEVTLPEFVGNSPFFWKFLKIMRWTVTCLPFRDVIADDLLFLRLHIAGIHIRREFLFHKHINHG